MNTLVIYSFLLFQFLFAFERNSHDIHLSMAEIEVNEKSTEFSIRIFSDDLLYAILNRFDLKIIPDDADMTKNLIKQYISERFVIDQNEKIIPFETISIEPGAEAFWCTFRIISDQFDYRRSFRLTNSVLFEIFKDQTNIVHFNYPTGKKVFTFDRKNESKEILL